MKNIKNYTLLLFLSVLMFSVISCKKNDGERVPVSTDQTKPGIVTDIKVDDYNGGSYITYDLPASENILYILAKYEIRKGVSQETKSSYYSDTIKVEGFAKEQEYDVTLYTVSRANVMSDPVTVKVHPQTPVFTLVKQTAAIKADFGGINVQALNPLKKEVGILVLAYDPATQAMEVQDQHYTKDSVINYSVRGYNTDERNFGVYITDKYGNVSDTLQSPISPLFEQLLDKGKFSPFVLASDTEIGYGWVLQNIWDGIGDGSRDGWHTLPGKTPPFVCTFNVGLTYKLSRFILYERSDQYAYGHGNPKKFSLWGSNKPNPANAALPLNADEGAVVGDWINLGNYNYPPPPSGLPPLANTASDKAFIKAGVNFNISLNAPPVHFIRVSTEETWSGGTFAHFMEISLYGKPE